MSFEKEKVKACIVKSDGRIIREYYQNAKVKTKLHKINSCTKSFTGILLGIALDQGYIISLDEKISKYFPCHFLYDYCTDKEDITIRHLVTMTSGINWPEFGEWNYFSPMNFSKDIFEFILQRPMAVNPGQKMNYSSGDSHLLGEIIAKATDRTLIDFAKDRLFTPLEIDEFHWLERDGHALAADGLRIRISDLIKLAELYLNKGVWHGKRVVSEEWISESLFPRFLTYEYIGNYGYHVWSKEIQIRSKNVRAYFALGYRGQFAVLVPDLKITAAIVSDVNDSMRPFYLLINSINDLI